MVDWELLLRKVPPLLQVKDGRGQPYATHTNIPVLPAVSVALSDMIAMNVSVGILIINRVKVVLLQMQHIYTAEYICS